MIFAKKERILYGNRFNGTNGNGYQPIKKEMTNEEWLHTLNTEQLAEWIVHLADDCTMQHECNLCNSWCDEKRVMEWLKQPHIEKE